MLKIEIDIKINIPEERLLKKLKKKGKATICGRPVCCEAEAMCKIKRHDNGTFTMKVVMEHPDTREEKVFDFDSKKQLIKGLRRIFGFQGY